jgi:hypothetical protein
VVAVMRVNNNSSWYLRQLTAKVVSALLINWIGSWNNSSIDATCAPTMEFLKTKLMSWRSILITMTWLKSKPKQISSCNLKNSNNRRRSGNSKWKNKNRLLWMLNSNSCNYSSNNNLNSSSYFSSNRNSSNIQSSNRNSKYMRRSRKMMRRKKRWTVIVLNPMNSSMTKAILQAEIKA